MPRKDGCTEILMQHRLSAQTPWLPLACSRLSGCLEVLLHFCREPGALLVYAACYLHSRASTTANRHVSELRAMH